MGRKTHDLSESSLDLLLDTVTNAFGGILFLSILIVLMLRMTTEHASPAEATADQPSQAEMLQLQSHLADASSELAQLQAVAALQADFADNLTDDLIKVTNQALHAMRELRDAAVDERVRKADQLAELQDSNNELREEMRDTEESLEKQRERLKEVQQELATETAARTRSASLPQAKATAKLEAPLIVRYGRVYMLHVYNSAGLPTGFNTDDYLVLDNTSGRIHLTPKPYAGVPLEDEAKIKVALRAMLATLTPQRHYVALAVMDDSFEEFALLKKCLIELGFEYRLLPIPVGESIGSSDNVTPRVQ